MHKIVWLEEEDKLLQSLCQNMGVKNWKKIGSTMNSIFTDAAKTPKQYRERYINYSRFNYCGQTKGAWNQEQDQLIFQKYAQFGSKWVQIAKFVTGRSENSVKNRFYSTIKKMMRKINMSMFKNRQKNSIKKPLRQESIIKLLSYTSITQDQQNASEQSRNKASFIQELKRKCLNAAKMVNFEEANPVLYELGLQIHSFNVLTRFQLFKKRRESTANKRKCLPPVPKQCAEHIKKQVQIENILEGYECQNKESTNQFSKHKQYKNFQDWNNQAREQEQRQKDLQYQICLILGTKYEPQRFKFAEFEDDALV